MGIFSRKEQFRAKDYSPDFYYYRRKNKKTYIIHHFCPHTYNMGDHFVILSIRKHIKKHLPNVLFVPKAIAGNRGWGKPIGLKGVNIYKANQEADAVIMGGSDQYNNWSPRVEKNEITHLKPPLFLIGLGVSSKEIHSSPYLKKDKYKEDILATNRHSRLSSVRDDITQRFLNNLGYTGSINTGCPAVYLFNEPFKVRKNLKNICLTFPSHLVHKKNAPDHKYTILHDAMKETIDFIKSKDMNPVVVCHDDRDVSKAQWFFPDSDLYFSNYPLDYKNLYQNSIMLLGSRLHASIFTAGLGVPFVNVNIDLRGKGFSKDFELDEWNIDYNNPDLSKILKERIRQVLAGDLKPLKNLEEIKSEKFKIFDKFIKQTVEEIKSANWQ